MRIFPDWIKTTLKEDKEFYRCIIDALNAHPNKDQLRILSRVKHHHLEKNRDLMTVLYVQFITVLDELNISKPITRVNERDQEAGSWYPIPKKGTTHGGKTHHERLASRASNRFKMWSALVEALTYTPGEVDTMLALPDSQIGELRDSLFEGINDLEKHYGNDIEELRETIQTLSKADFDMQVRIERLEAMFV